MRDYYFYATNALIDTAATDKQKKVCADLKERNRRLRILEQYKIPEYIETELSTYLPFPWKQTNENKGKKGICKQTVFKNRRING
ncbi:MAG: hypothetical protein IPP27_17755 [Bacteroidetes bacterium]|nr:hypothetical protein [Bacteroidota bacterium]